MRKPLLKPSIREAEGNRETASIPTGREPNTMTCPVEEIAQAYLTSTHGDAGIALRCAITDALSDLMEAERRARENSRLISRGYVRNAAFRW